MVTREQFINTALSWGCSADEAYRVLNLTIDDAKAELAGWRTQKHNDNCMHHACRLLRRRVHTAPSTEAPKLQIVDGLAERDPQDWVRDVTHFHQRVLGDPPPRDPEATFAGGSPMELGLMQEEFKELLRAMASNNVSDIAGELVDLVYTTIGLSLRFGIDLRLAWPLVHEANMKKKGGTFREDGKVQKPEGWEPADLSIAVAKGVYDS